MLPYTLRFSEVPKVYEIPEEAFHEDVDNLHVFVGKMIDEYWDKED